jgi:hypothetical protein
VTRVLRLAVLVLVVAAGASCAPPKRRVAVPIDQRPTPAAADTVRRAPAPMSRRTETTARQRVIADTTAARAVLARCAGRRLLPDQQGVFDSTTDLLIQARRALRSGDLAVAGSRARQARQLTTSLRCR